MSNSLVDTLLSGLTPEDKSKLVTNLITGLLKGTDNSNTNFFRNDGSPAKELESNRDELIHKNEIKDAMDSLLSSNSVDNDRVSAIEKVNDPKVSTEAPVDKYNLTADKRKWILEYIFCVEGGYFNHPNDPGGETMYGIIKTEARAHGYNGPMRDLPKEVATEIYLRKYWNANRMNEIKDFKKALCIFDFLVNSGSRGIKVAQRAVNKSIACRSKLSTTKELYKDLSPLVVDGKIGAKTIEAINTIRYGEFIKNYFYLQEDTYEDLMRANTKLRSFDEGWENRMSVKAAYLAELEARGY